MHRWVSFAATHGRNYITSSSSSFSRRRFLNPNNLLFSNPNNLLRNLSSSTSCNPNDDVTASVDFQNLMSLLSNATPPEGHRYHLHLTNLLHHQHFLLKFIQTSCQTKLVETLKVPPYNLIHFIKKVWNTHKGLITTHVLESLVESICSNLHYEFDPKLREDCIFLLWDLLNYIDNYQSGLVNTQILNRIIEYFSTMKGQGKDALGVFDSFDIFECVPNHDTYYFTLQALLCSTMYSADMIHQAASICEKMMLLSPHSHDDEEDNNYRLPPYNDDSTTYETFQERLTNLGSIPPIHACRYDLKSAIRFMMYGIPSHHQRHFLLKFIETSCQTKLVEIPNVPPHNLINFVEWVWKNHKDLITTPVLESLVSSICPTDPSIYDVELKKKDIHFLWNLLKLIGHRQTGLLNTRILNQLLGFFRHIWVRHIRGNAKKNALEVFYEFEEGKDELEVVDKFEEGKYKLEVFHKFEEGKDALEVFHKFEEFQCVPNQDTYYFTLQTICQRDTSWITEQVHPLQLTSSICQEMVLHPEAFLIDDCEILGNCLAWFSENNMIKEVSALYLAANEKWKRNLNMLFPTIKILFSRKETVHLALVMLTHIDIPVENPTELGLCEKDLDLEMLTDIFRKNLTKLGLCEKVIGYLCPGKHFDAAKQLILKMIADDSLPRPSEQVFNRIIRAYVEAREYGQALEMVMLLESIGLNTCDAILYDKSHSYGICMAKKILEEAKRKDSKLIIALLYHTLIVRYCDGRIYDDAARLFTQMNNFGEALKFLTDMKDFGFSINLDEYHKFIHSLYLKAMDRKLIREQLEEMEPMDREMVKEQLIKMSTMDSRMADEKLKEMNLNIRASFS